MDAGLRWGWVHASTPGWDNDCRNGVGNFFLNSAGWHGVVDKLCGNGWEWGSLGRPLVGSDIMHTIHVPSVL